MLTNNCLLCHDAKCTKTCGHFEPDRLLRSLFFDNRNVVRNELADGIPCAACDAPCEKVCPVGVNIRDLILEAGKDVPEKRRPISYDCLKTDFCGIPMENPFMLSSSAVSANYDMVAYAFEQGWGGVAYKTICLMDINEASPRYSAIKGDSNRIIGFKNIEQLSDHELIENIATFKRLKENYPDKFLLVSVMGRDEEEWAYLARVLDKSGADALELNFSCPNMTEEHTGSDVGQIPELVERYCRVVRENTSLPFIAKLTPNITHIEESADAAIRGGADGVAAINTIKSLIEVDIDPSDGIFNASIGGYSGKAVKPIALRFITELSQDRNLTGKHISAMGGIETWRDALEFIVLGADTIQVTTAVMQYGTRIVQDMKDGLALYLADHGYSSIKELDGVTVGGIIPTNELDRSYIIYPKFDRTTCVGCGRCHISCMDGGHQAIEMKDDRPVMNASKCVGCHLCILVCPMGAISSSEKKVPKNK